MLFVRHTKAGLRHGHGLLQHLDGAVRWPVPGARLSAESRAYKVIIVASCGLQTAAVALPDSNSATWHLEPSQTSWQCLAYSCCLAVSATQLTCMSGPAARLPAEAKPPGAVCSSAQARLTRSLRCRASRTERAFRTALMGPSTRAAGLTTCRQVPLDGVLGQQEAARLLGAMSCHSGCNASLCACTPAEPRLVRQRRSSLLDLGTLVTVSCVRRRAMGSCAGQAAACTRACGTAGAGTAGASRPRPAGPCELVRLCQLHRSPPRGMGTTHAVTQRPLHPQCIQGG